MKRKKIVKLVGTLAFGITALVGSNFTYAEDVLRTQVSEFSNVLDLSATPTQKTYGPYATNYFNNFSDLGAWHGYYQPAKDESRLLGGFAGPLIFAEEYPVNLSDSINKITITNSKTKKAYDLSQSNYIDLAAYPGKLEQVYEMEDFTLKLNLIFVSNRSAIIQTNITNKTDKPLKLDIGWSGRIFDTITDGSEKIKIGTSLKEKKNQIQVNFSKVRKEWNYMSTKEVKYTITHDKNVKTSINDLSYKTKLKDSITIKPEQTFTTNTTESYTFTKDETDKEIKATSKYLKDTDKYYKANQTRWQGYLDSAFKNDQATQHPEYQNAVVKSIETLTTNWRSPAGSITQDGVIPSMSYK